MIRKRIQEIKASGAPVVVSSTPVNARKYGKIASEENVDAFLINPQLFQPSIKVPMVLKRWI